MATRENHIKYETLDPNVEYIKIHGLQRSGTNYISHLIDTNFKNAKSLVNLGGWKHGFYAAPWFLGKEVHVIMITKNPYSWLVSMFRYWGPDKKLRIGPNLEGVTFDEFVRNRCIFERQRDIPFLYRSTNPVQHWNNMNFHWMSIRMNLKNVFVMTYESLTERTHLTLSNIETAFKLERVNEEFSDCDKTFQPTGEITKPTDQRWNKDYYKKAEYLDMFSQDLLDFVNDQLDLDVMCKLEYDYVTEAR